MRILGRLYGRVAAWRRAWYDADPSRRRTLARPVISVGNLAVGGSGKTPAVAAIARLLLQRGERPAILSRGYGRRDVTDGVVVVSDGQTVLAPATRSGDEPQMLARALSGVPVLVARERFLAGCLAERQFGATVHLLDDGFQHLPLGRDIDLVIVSRDDLEADLLPAGRLRESLATARRADAILVPGNLDDVSAVEARLGGRVFRLVARYEPLRVMGPEQRGDDPAPQPGSGTPVVAVAGIARPQRFFAALRDCGFDVRREIRFRDHHWFSVADVQAIEQAAMEVGAAVIVTTEKDAVRLATRPRWYYLPMVVAVEPEAVFSDWLAARLHDARERRGTAA